MKDTIQLHEIAPYLPYNLPMLRVNKLGEWKKIHLGCGNIGDANNHPGYKPILQPISEWRSLEDGTQFLTPYTHSLVDADGGLEGNIMSIPYADFIWLVSRHFDVFNLIGRGLAVDINTLKD